MFELDTAIQEVLSNSREANDFNQLVETLSTFCTSIRHITLQDKKVLIQLVTSTSLSIYSMCKMDDLLASDIRTFTNLQSNIRKIENIVSLFVYRMSQWIKGARNTAEKIGQFRSRLWRDGEMVLAPIGRRQAGETSWIEVS